MRRKKHDLSLTFLSIKMWYLDKNVREIKVNFFFLFNNAFRSNNFYLKNVRDTHGLKRILFV